MGKKLNIIGKRFGKLLVLNETNQIGRFRYCKCKCDCGKEKIIRMSNLTVKIGATRSCGECDWGILNINQDKIDKYKALYKKSNRGCAIRLIARARSNAERKGIIFNIDYNDILPIIKLGFCQITGSKFIIKNDFKNPFRPSIDRIDSNKGYIKDNIQVVTWIYNLAKNMYEHSDVLQMARDLVKKENKNLVKHYRMQNG